MRTRVLKVEQRHIDKGEKLRLGDRYVVNKDCPVMLAAREQVDKAWNGAYSFLHAFATMEGRKAGYIFIQKFDSKQNVEPIEIGLEEEVK